MSSRRSPLAGTLIVLTGAFLFATLGPLSRFAYERGMDPLSFVAWRAGLATVALAAVVCGPPLARWSCRTPPCC